MARRGGVLTDVIGVAVAVESARRARSQEVGAREERVFRAVNDAPDAIHPPVWAVMQSGSLGAVFVAAGHLHRRGNPGGAAVAAVSGTVVWGGVKLIKPLVRRGRPRDHLSGVTVRGAEQRGLGYPSGHAAVAMTLAEVTTVACSPAGRTVAHLVAATTGGARVYVGAHLPLDVAGGLALGSVVGRRVRARLASP